MKGKAAEQALAGSADLEEMVKYLITHFLTD